MMIKVFEGGDGSISGGSDERSRESGDLLLDEARECDGDGMPTCMFAAAIMCVWCVDVCVGEREKRKIGVVSRCG